MTDNDIVKALERLKTAKDYLKEQYKEQVKKCPYPELKPIAKQTYEDNKNAFDIAIKAIEEFNRQKAEIERLQEEIELLHTDYTYKLVKRKAKAEAIKEFAERLKGVLLEEDGYCIEIFNEVELFSAINNLMGDV